MLQENTTKKQNINKRRWFTKTFWIILISALTGLAVYYLWSVASEKLIEVKRTKQREGMVIELDKKGINDREVLRAMGRIPRHIFLFEPYRELAYENRPLYMSYNWRTQQPYMTAFIAQNLELDKGDKVLIIGIKSGYPLAVLAELTKEVYAIERVRKILGKDPTIKKRISEVEKILDVLGYNNVYIDYTDDYSRWEESGPFDGIILNEPANSVPLVLTDQLKQGGRLILPLEKEENLPQDLTLIEKIGDEFESRVLIKVLSATEEEFLLLHLEGKLTPEE